MDGTQRQVAAIARTAAALAPRGSLAATLDGLAGEVLKADPVAGVQILTPDGDGTLRAMGSAGFRHWPDFFERLLECRRYGATLRMQDAFTRGEPVVVADRWAAIRDDPAWTPMRDYLAELRWEAFVSIPLVTAAETGERGPAAGVLNVFLAPGRAANDQILESLAAMAEQAAIAVGYAALIRGAQQAARQEERRRLARELHDSVVQQVFSISLQAASLRLLSRRGAVGPDSVEPAAAEIAGLAQGALADLDAMVHELSPASPAGTGGLAAATRALTARQGARPGPQIRLLIGDGVDAVAGELAEDAYRVIAEAVHNVVKHARAGTATIRLGVRGGRLRASVTDNGCGLPGPVRQGSGHGLRAMRERAERWDGRVTIGPGRGGGTVVRLVIPLPSAPATPGRGESGTR